MMEGHHLNPPKWSDIHLIGLMKKWLKSCSRPTLINRSLSARCGSKVSGCSQQPVRRLLYMAPYRRGYRDTKGSSHLLRVPQTVNFRVKAKGSLMGVRLWRPLGRD